MVIKKDKEKRKIIAKAEDGKEEKIDDSKSAESKARRKKNGDRLLIGIIAVMVFLIAVVFIVNWAVHKPNYIVYDGLKFTIEKQGNIPIYHYWYLYVNHQNTQIKYNLYLRNDPRKLDVPVEGDIAYPAGKTVYVGINNTGFETCEDNSLSMGILGSFLRDNGIEFKPGVMDQKQAQTLNMSLITCNKNVTNMFILVNSGNETKITRDGNCYTINIANCDLVKAVEKWEVQSIIDARNFARNQTGNNSGVYSLK